MSGPIAAALAGQPDLASLYTAFRDAAHRALGAERSDMIRQVIAQVHGCEPLGGSTLDGETRAALVDWRSGDRFSAGQRACLAYAERLPFEHTAIADDEADAVVSELGEAGYVAFSIVAALADAECRAAMIDLPRLAAG